MRISWVAGAILSLVVVTFGCRSVESEDRLVVFHYNQHNNITSLDPAYAKSQNNIWAVNHIYSTLLKLDDSLNVIPSVAHSWDVSPDGKTYSFYLRDDILFHESACFNRIEDRRLTAADVAYSFNRLIDTTLNAPGSWIFADKVIQEDPFQALDDTTFQLRLKYPFAPLPSLLTMQYCSIVPKEAIGYFGNDFFKNPVGSGPFQFKKWIDSQGLFLIRNKDYYNWEDVEMNNLEGIRTSFIGERSIAFLEMVNTRIDFFSGLESSYINTALTPQGNLKEEYNERIQFLKSPYLNLEYLGMNPNAGNAHPLLKEKTFRQALNYGIDRRLMLTSLRNNIGVPADAGVITRGLPAYNPEKVKGYSFDSDAASKLLSEFDAELLQIPIEIQTSKDYLDLTTYIAKQWENLGLVVKIEVMESAVLRNAMRNENVGIFRASWIADYPDGESFLSMFFGQNPAPPNYTRFSNEEYDQLYMRALRITDESSKIDLYQEMDRMIVEEAPVIFLFYDEAAIFANKKLSGISRNALNLLQIENINKAL